MLGDFKFPTPEEARILMDRRVSRLEKAVARLIESESRPTSGFRSAAVIEIWLDDKPDITMDEYRQLKGIADAAESWRIARESATRSPAMASHNFWEKVRARAADKD